MWGHCGAREHHGASGCQLSSRGGPREMISVIRRGKGTEEKWKSSILKSSSGSNLGAAHWVGPQRLGALPCW